MAQLIVSWFIDGGRFRVHAINAVGRRKGRIIEVEEVDTRERFHGSARRLERLVWTLRVSSGESEQVSAWKPDSTS
jgi:hypothetical protein